MLSETKRADCCPCFPRHYVGSFLVGFLDKLTGKRNLLIICGSSIAAVCAAMLALKGLSFSGAAGGAGEFHFFS